MFINKESPYPAYHQLKNSILRKIQSGEFPSGNPIPSERELSETLNISRMTVRQALNQLVTEGILYRERGKGTFVSKTKIIQRNIMSFSDTVRQKGLIPSTRILNFIKEEAQGTIVQILDLEQGEEVYNIKRLRLANENPIGIENVFIARKYCPGLEQYDLTQSLYKLIREEYGYTINYLDNVIESLKPSKEENQLLHLVTSIPILKTSGISYTHSGTKLIYERSCYRSDEYRYSVRVYVTQDME